MNKHEYTFEEAVILRPELVVDIVREGVPDLTYMLDAEVIASIVKPSNWGAFSSYMDAYMCEHDMESTVTSVPVTKQELNKMSDSDFLEVLHRITWKEAGMPRPLSADEIRRISNRLVYNQAFEEGFRQGMMAARALQPELPSKTH